MAKKFYVMTDIKRHICECDAKTIAFYRRNPCIACEDLLGIRLLDSQKLMLQNSWNTPHVLWCCSRNFGKSFLGAVFMILKAMLYENQAIYILAPIGDQSKETFSKLEEIVLRVGKTSASIRSLKDIAEKETVKTPTNKTGFSHNPAGYRVEFYNGSEIITLNGNPDNNRSKRATMVFFDEAAFCSDELIAICEAFATQNTDFITDIDDSYNPEVEPRRVPTQLVYASSQDQMDKLFYRHYKNFAKRMLAGDRDYYVCDMICDTAIQTFMNGKPYTPLLTQDKVDAALKSNRDKALREYYNAPTRDGGVNQIVKWATIRRNESFLLPQFYWDPNYKYVLAFDPARTIDNSVVGVMRLYEDQNYGLCGDIINCVNMIDVATKKKYKLDSPRQIQQLHNLLLDYNGDNPDYEYIDTVMIDAGAGGGGVSAYADALLSDWTDDRGKTHRGLIDADNELYATYVDRYPDAVNKLRLISPKKWRTKMVEEMIDLMDIGVLRLPREYSGQDIVKIPNGVDPETGDEIFLTHEFSLEEGLALGQLDLMKNEITAIQRYSNPENTAVTYALSKEKENTMHDDRFYVSIMLAHRLAELRRGKAIRQHAEKDDFDTAPSLVSVVNF